MNLPASLEVNGWKLLLASAALSLVVHLISFAFIQSVVVREPKASIDQIYIFPDVSVALPAIETLQETAAEAPKDAKFISDRHLSTDEETSPDLQIHDIAQAQSGRAKTEVSETQSRISKESFTLSESDKLALNDPLVSGRAAPSELAASPGFYERLKRGDALKVNALRSDTGGYVNRIKRKLQVMWNPGKTIDPAMYRYNRVTVTLAIVLNRKGELTDLRVIEPSFFPRYDEEALRTVRQSVPFPNPPDHLVQDDGLVYLTWGFYLATTNIGVAGVE